MVELNKIYLGHTLDILKSWPDSFIDSCITSPPYWGLRAYGTKPQIWDGNPKCKHQRKEERTERMNSSGGQESKKLAVKNKENFQESTNYKDRATYSNTCHLCGAWRGELGTEPHFNLFINHLIQIFDEVKRILKPTGTCWVNLGDSYGGTGDKGTYKDPKYPNGRNGQAKAVNKNAIAKSLCCIPDRFKIAMIDNDWICRNEIIWYKRNCMPSSASDRFTVDFEKIFFFTKQKKYWFKQQFEDYAPSSDVRYRQKLRAGKTYNSKEPYKENLPYHSIKRRSNDKDGLCIGGGNPQGRNMRTVWNIPTKPYKEAHFATFPPALPTRCLISGCPTNGIVLDPFMGSGTTAVAAKLLKVQWLGIELNPEYKTIADKRINDATINGTLEGM
jgi:site-specific DNA-methyltransferase (adenine-specific)